MNVFLDSSALAKRYVEEPGSDRVQEILSDADSLGLSILCPVEVASALSRRLREGRLTPSQHSQAKRALLADVADATVVGFTDQIVSLAISYLESFPLRSSDAVHVAAAREWCAERFVTADLRQCRVAEEIGLLVEFLDFSGGRKSTP